MEPSPSSAPSSVDSIRSLRSLPPRSTVISRSSATARSFVHPDFSLGSEPSLRESWICSPSASVYSCVKSAPWHFMFPVEFIPPFPTVQAWSVPRSGTCTKRSATFLP